MIVKRYFVVKGTPKLFESSVNSYDSQTTRPNVDAQTKFESSVNSYDSQTTIVL